MRISTKYRRKTLRMLFLLSLAAVVLWGVTRFEKNSVRHRPGSGGRLDWPIENAELMIIERDDLRMEFKKTGADGGWRMVGPMDTRVDESRVRRILDVAAEMVVTERISAGEMRLRGLTLQDFGLLHPSARFLLADAWNRFELLFGHDLALGDSVYASEPDSADVLVVPRSIMLEWPDSVEAIRDRALLGSRPENVNRIEIFAPGEPFVQLSRTGSGWRMQQPFNAAAENNRIENFLRELYAVRIEEFIWPREEDRQDGASLRERLVGLGLDREDSTVRVRLREFGWRRSGELRLGVPSGNDTGLIAAYWSLDDTIVSVSDSIRESLSLSADSWRDPRLLSFNAEEVNVLEIRRREDFIRLERNRDSGKWHLIAPIDDPADTHTVNAFLGMLKDLRSTERIPEKNVPAIDSGNVALKIGLASASLNVDVTFFEGERKDELLARVAGENLIYRLRRDEEAPRFALECRPADFHDRSILALPTGDIRRISMNTASGTAVFERDELGTWMPSRPTAGRVDGNGLEDLLLRAANLRATGVEALSVSERGLAAYGLEPAEASVTFDLRDGDALSKTLLIGSETQNGGRYVMVRGHDVIFELAGVRALRFMTPPLSTPE